MALVAVLLCAAGCGGSGVWMVGCGSPRASVPGGTPPAGSYQLASYDLRKANVSATVSGASVTSAFFETSKARPLVGRLFLPEEYRGSGLRLVVLSNAIWKRSFGGDPGLLGQRLELNGKEFTVVGIMPQSFDFPPGSDLWIPQP